MPSAMEGDYDNPDDDSDSDAEEDEEPCIFVEEVQGKPVKIEIPCGLLEEQQLMPTQGQFQ